MTDAIAEQRDRFEAWYYEQEVFSARAERLSMSYAEAQAAFDAGWSAALAAPPVEPVAIVRTVGHKGASVDWFAGLGEECSVGDLLYAAHAVPLKDEQMVRVLENHLRFVERWANHHASKPHVTPQEALSVIQHYPPIKAITKAYADGKVPDTSDPYEHIRVLREALSMIKAENEASGPVDLPDELAARIDAALETSHDQHIR